MKPPSPPSSSGEHPDDVDFCSVSSVLPPSAVQRHHRPIFPSTVLGIQSTIIDRRQTFENSGSNERKRKKEEHNTPPKTLEQPLFLRSVDDSDRDSSSESQEADFRIDRAKATHNEARPSVSGGAAERKATPRSAKMRKRFDAVSRDTGELAFTLLTLISSRLSRVSCQS